MYLKINEVFQFISEEISKKNLMPPTRISRIYPRENKKFIEEHITKTLNKIIALSKNHISLFIQLNITNSINHVIGFFAKKSIFYFYDPNIPNRVPPYEINKEIFSKTTKITDYISKHYLIDEKKITTIAFSTVVENDINNFTTLDLSSSSTQNEFSLIEDDEILFHRLMEAVYWNDVDEVSELLSLINYQQTI